LLQATSSIPIVFVNVPDPVGSGVVASMGRPGDVRERSGIGEGLAAFASKPDHGLIVLVGASPSIHRDFIIAEVARLGVPTVYPYRQYAVRGGLMSYGPDLLDQYRGAAGYVDRILKGDKPGDLPVQAPTTYQLVINLRTATALGIAIPPTLLAQADEVIE